MSGTRQAISGLVTHDVTMAFAAVTEVIAISDSIRVEACRTRTVSKEHLPLFPQRKEALE
jgi:hypothetical protein